MRVVLDTNVLISATLWEGSAHKVLLRLIEEDAKIYLSRAILEEYENSIKRDFVQVAERLPTLLETILSFSTLVEPTAKINVVSDPDDNKIIECALEADADYILTYDKQLLKLGKYGKAQIVKPEAFSPQTF